MGLCFSDLNGIASGPGVAHVLHRTQGHPTGASARPPTDSCCCRVFLFNGQAQALNALRGIPPVQGHDSQPPGGDLTPAVLETTAEAMADADRIPATTPPTPQR